jgi:ribosome maturation factor RimP
VAVDVTERLIDALSPVVAASGLELVDVVLAGAGVQVVVDRPGGVDLDALAEVNQALSRALDRVDPFPGRYTLEVSSPGLERRLRTPEHFARAVGETVSVRTLAGMAPQRRVHGVLTAADESGCTVEGPELPEGSVRLGYDAIERARTVFAWGPPERAQRPEGRARRQKRERSRS